jgi:enoyl-[acyl-carrier protein] reductase II
MRTLRTELSAEAERQAPAPSLSLEGIRALYFGGEMNAAYAMSGQVAGRVTEVLPVRQILETTWRDCQARLRQMGNRATG